MMENKYPKWTTDAGLEFAELFPELRRWNVINYMIKRYGYTSYLEVGVHNKECYNHIECDHKECVDVQQSFKPTYRMTSDRFFEKYKDKRYDLIFVDGYHERSQVKRDIINALKMINEGGMLICHDVNPVMKFHLSRGKCWSAWEAFAELRCERNDIEMYTLPFDHLGIIRKGSQEPYNGEWQRTWNFLEKHRDDLMHQLTPDQFLEIFGK